MADLRDLQPLAQKLNTATDDLNAALKTIEDHLNAMSIGIEAWLEDELLDQTDWRDVLNQDTEPTGSRWYSGVELGYGRCGDGWALLTRERRFEHSSSGEIEIYEDNPDDRKPLLRAARHLRIAAVPLIRQLFDNLKDAAERAIRRVEKVKEIADTIGSVPTNAPASSATRVVAKLVD